jgi:type IV pilus assembly protein PilE
MKSRNLGMTLVELVVVVAILALLVSIALPSYREFRLRANRAEAKTALMQLAAAQEKFYLQNNTYADDGQLDAAPPAGLGLSATTEHGFYTIEIDAADVDGYTATATAAGRQADDEDCASFTVNQAGEKTATTDECWRK